MKMNPKDAELYRRIDEALHYIWDPIGVAGAPYARDEYQHYVPALFRMIKSDEESEVVVRHLTDIAENGMALKANVENCRRVVEILKAYKKKIFDEDA